jgi:lysozyme
MTLKDMKPSKNFFSLLVMFEGLETKAYKDSAGIPTIGIGTIRYPNGTRVKMGDKCTIDQAYEYAQHDINKKVGTINGLLIGVDVNQNQFDAICSLVYNVGEGAFASSRTLKQIKKDRNNFDAIEPEWMGFNKQTVNGKKEVVRGLTNRRKKEFQLYETPVKDSDGSN